MTPDKLYGNNGSDFIFGDFALLTFDELAPNLYGILSIDSLNCTEGGGTNEAYGWVWSASCATYIIVLHRSLLRFFYLQIKYVQNLISHQ